jgi:hypothetical protein
VKNDEASKEGKERKMIFWLRQEREFGLPISLFRSPISLFGSPISLFGRPISLLGNQISLLEAQITFSKPSKKVYTPSLSMLLIRIGIFWMENQFPEALLYLAKANGSTPIYSRQNSISQKRNFVIQSPSSPFPKSRN